MTALYIYTLKALRKFYCSFNTISEISVPSCDQDPDSVSQKIFNALSDGRPYMIGRFGAYELDAVINYLGVKAQPKDIISFIKGEALPWWWEKELFYSMFNNAGFFPPQKDKIEKFCEFMIQDIQLVDILGSWLPKEHYFDKELQKCYKVSLELLNPYFSSIPWTRALEGKKILVVHPFSQTIENQYKKRGLLFKDNLLPTFELKTIKAVQSIAGEKTKFVDWFEALDYMKDEINKVDYDICLIGCGAYGFLLAAHVKRMGKIGFHLGGSLQLLFGIRGKRWENENYNKIYNYSQLMNEYWVKPDEREIPKNAIKVENACYW